MFLSHVDPTKGILKRKGCEELNGWGDILCGHLSAPFHGHPLTDCHDHLHFLL